MVGSCSHQEREAIKAGCAHSEIQVIDEGGLGRHSGWVVVPDQRDCEGPAQRLQTVLMRLAGGQISQIHNLQVPAWPGALHQPTYHQADPRKCQAGNIYMMQQKL